MGSYMFKVTYSAEGLKGIESEGGEHRVAFIKKMAKKLGGKVVSFYFAFGETDAYVICEIPDDNTAAAIAMAVGASGTGSLRDCQAVDACGRRRGARDLDGVQAARRLAP